MNKKLSAGLLVCLMVAVAVASAPARPAQAANSYYFNFQQSTKPFVAQASQNAATKLSRVVGACPCEPILSNYFARLASRAINNVVPGPGQGQATWMVANLPVGQGQAYSVTISWTARAVAATAGSGNCKTCSAIAYAGAAPPKGVKDFRTVPQATTMNAKWATYKFSTVIVPELSPNAYVALGWNGINSAIDVDCVTVTIVPIVR